MRNFLAILMGAAVGAALLASGPAAAGPLEKELVGILTDHPKIASAEKGVESSAQGVKTALSNFLPTVAMAADHGPEFIDSPGIRARNDDGHRWSRSRTTASVTVTQNVFSGFSTASLVRAARLNKEVARISLEGTRQATLFEGIRAYVDVLRQKRLTELAAANERTIQTQLNLEDERVQRGSGIAVDVLQAKSRLQIAKERRVNFEGGLVDAISTYMQVFDHAPEIDEMTDPVPPVELVPAELEDAIDIALKENPAVSTSDATIEVARERKRTVRAEYFPVFDVVGSWNFEKHNSSTVGTRRDYSVILQGSWDLFTGVSTRASLAQMAFDHGASLDNYRLVSRKVTEQIKLSWQALLTVRERLELLENAVNIAAEVFQSRKKLREAGKETVINVLDAEGEVMNAQINFAAASYDQRVAIYQILLAMGRLTAEYLRLATG